MVVSCSANDLTEHVQKKKTVILVRMLKLFLLQSNLRRVYVRFNKEFIIQ